PDSRLPRTDQEDRPQTQITTVATRSCRAAGRARERPGRRDAGKQCDELPPSHSITSSAWASSDGGTARPSAFAVPALITDSDLIGCSNGISEGFAPLRILSKQREAWRNCSGRSTP